MAGPARPGRPPTPSSVVAYIIRRLIATVGLLFVVSVITFSIFYLVPRIAGSSPETLATRYVGRTATEETVKDVAETLGFYDPIVRAVRQLGQGPGGRGRLRHGRRGRALPAAVPRLLLHHPPAGRPRAGGPGTRDVLARRSVPR